MVRRNNFFANAIFYVALHNKMWQMILIKPGRTGRRFQELSVSQVMSPVETLTAEAVDQATAFVTQASKVAVPEAARAFVKRAAEGAKERAAEVNANVAKANETLAAAATQGIGEVVRVNGALRDALYADATAFFDVVGKIAGAGSFSEVVKIQGEYVRERSDVGLARSREVADYVSKAAAEAAKSTKDGIAKFAPQFGVAA